MVHRLARPRWKSSKKSHYGEIHYRVGLSLLLMDVLESDIADRVIRKCGNAT